MGPTNTTKHVDDVLNQFNITQQGAKSQEMHRTLYGVAYQCSQDRLEAI